MVSGVERRRAQKHRDRKRRRKEASSNESEHYISTAHTTSNTSSAPPSTASASSQSAQSAHGEAKSRRPALEKRILVQKDIQGIITTLKSDDVDDILSLSRRRELTSAAEQLDEHTRAYVQYGRRHADKVFESLSGVVAGLVGVLSDHNNEAKAAAPQKDVAPASAAPESTPTLPDIASTMARLEARLNTMAAEVAGLIHHIEESKSRPPSQRL